LGIGTESAAIDAYGIAVAQVTAIIFVIVFVIDPSL